MARICLKEDVAKNINTKKKGVTKEMKTKRQVVSGRAVVSFRKSILRTEHLNIIALVKKHHSFKGKPPGDCHTAFGSLYEMVMHGRNDALHQGAFARILTLHLRGQVALFLEDSLMAMREPSVLLPVLHCAFADTKMSRKFLL